MSNSGAFRFPKDIQTTLDPWKAKLDPDFEQVVALLRDRDRDLEDYISRYTTQIFTLLANFPTTSLQKGQLAYAQDTALLYAWNGAAWVAV